MKFIIEADGPVLDVQPIYWAAYSTAVAEIGQARTDPAAFWRIIRRGDRAGLAVRGANPRQLQLYEARIAELIESDDAVAHGRPQPGVTDALRRLGGRGECVMVTLARNRAGRQKILDAEDLAIHFFQMLGLAAETTRRGDQLRAVVDGDPQVMAAAATPSMVRAAVGADLPVVGVTNGASTGRRLTQAGAQCTFADLPELADELDRGAPELVRLGLLHAAPKRKESTPLDPHHRTSQTWSSRRRGGGGR